jgi:hypothetical protein
MCHGRDPTKDRSMSTQSSSGGPRAVVQVGVQEQLILLSALPGRAPQQPTSAARLRPDRTAAESGLEDDI